MQHVFFTVNDFSKEGGNTIRMYGIVNELASLGHTVYLVSNTVNFEQFHSKIKHIPINYKINIKAKMNIMVELSEYRPVCHRISETKARAKTLRFIFKRRKGFFRSFRWR